MGRQKSKIVYSIKTISNFHPKVLDNFIKNHPESINYKDIKNETLLSYSIKMEDVQKCELIISKPLLNLLYQDSCGNSYLHLSVKNQLIPITKLLLLKRGINIDSQNNLGNTALHYAYMLNNKKLISILIDNNVDTNIKNNDGLTPEQLVRYKSLHGDINSNNDKSLNKSNYNKISLDNNDPTLINRNKNNNKKNRNNDKKRGNTTKKSNITINKKLDFKKFFYSEIITRTKKIRINNITKNNSNVVNLENDYNSIYSHDIKDGKLIIEQEKDSSPNTSKTDSDEKEKPGDRARALIFLEERRGEYSFHVPKEVYCDDKKDENIQKIKNWLKMIKAENYLKNFLDGGYYSIELLLMQMNSQNPIEDILIKDELGITKVGLRSRIINKLIEDGKKFLIKQRENAKNIGH